MPLQGSLVTNKIPVPAEADSKAAQKKVREVFATDFKQAKGAQLRWQLAVKLAKEASATKDNGDEEYALTMEAIDLFISVGDILSAFRSLDELALTFEIDPITTKSLLFKRAIKEAKSTALKRMTALVGLKLAGDASAAEQFTTAKELATLSLTLAKPSRDPGVIKRATEKQNHYQELANQFQKVMEAREALNADENDAHANEVVGRYLCLIRQQWDEGLQYIAKGTNSDLSTAAIIDLNATDSVAEQSKAALAWWDIAESKDTRATDRPQFLTRVAYWYEKALPGLTGLSKVEAEKRLEAAYEAMSGRNFRKIMESQANGIRSEGLIDCTEKVHPANFGKGFDFRKSWLVSLQFNPPHLNGGWHMVLFWGDGRGGHDPLWFRQDGPWLICAVEDAVNERGQSINALLDARHINNWVDVKLVHDTVSQELELYVDHRLIRKEALAITPQTDQEMNVVLGGTNDYTGQRFTGQVRNVWIGNIK